MSGAAYRSFTFSSFKMTKTIKKKMNRAAYVNALDLIVEIMLTIVRAMNTQVILRRST